MTPNREQCEKAYNQGCMWGMGGGDAWGMGAMAEAHSSIDLLNTVPSSTTAEASSHADSSVHGTTTFGTTLHSDG